jgi:hypothetical protein
MRRVTDSPLNAQGCGEQCFARRADLDAKSYSRPDQNDPMLGHMS